MDDTYLTIKEIEHLFKVTRQAVCNWIKTGQLKAYKLGKYWRIEKKDIDIFKQNHKNF